MTNQSYLGIRTYGKTTEIRNPDTGKKERKDIPQEDWRVRERNPELQIVPDDLFWRVQEKRKVKSHNIGVKQLGGMTRTEASRKYLLSGALRCALCKGKLVIRTTKPARYGCAEYIERDGCENTHTISQELLEREFVHALSQMLLDGHLREELIQVAWEQVQSAKDTRLEAETSVDQRRKHLERTRATQAQHKVNLVKGVRESGGLKSLYEELGLVERSLERIDQELAELNRPPLPEVTLEEVRDFVNGQVADLENLLFGAAEALKLDLQRRIKQIFVTPVEDESGRRRFRLTGDVALFIAPEGVVQTNQVYSIGLHYMLPIDVTIVASKSTGRKEIRKAIRIRVASDLQRVGLNQPGDEVIQMESFIYRKGFGGLRLAAVEPQNSELDAVAA